VGDSNQSALIALAAAAFWGGGDFSGGMGVKAAGGGLRGAVRFVLLAHSMSLAMLLGLVLWLRQPVAFHAPALWAMAAGTAGSIGTIAFYSALSRGGMGVSAAVTGLLTAAIPVVVSSAIEGIPAGLKLAGFAVAAVAIWLIAAGDAPENEAGISRQTLCLTLFSGVAFGFYFVAIKLASPLGLVVPLAFARSASLMVLVPVLLAMGRSAWSPVAPASWKAGFRWVLAVELLDTGGNLLFLAASRLGRLDVASVVASLYPAGTILLAAWWLHERPTRRQVAGMVTALVAVVMITI
jgi:drug/metabolite transporter (DMT)-like permease